MQAEQLYGYFLRQRSVTTDTRKIKEGDIFFALKGPNFNGNKFAAEALRQGAAYVVADENPGFEDDRLLQVTDVLQSLQMLAAYHRSKYNIPVIAITGSNGKTTTKELLHQVLSTKYRCATTEGNLNNHIGIPLTLLKVPDDAEIMIIEMGANHLKEIESYCKIADPTHALITNCGKAHLEGFGGYEGVLKGKGELFEYIREHNRTAFIFDDYPYLKDLSKGISRIITYGTQKGDIIGNLAEQSELLHVRVTKGATVDIATNLIGSYNLPNVLAVVAIAKYFGLPDDYIKSAIEAYVPNDSRSQLIKKGTNKIILDAYNANPTSMKAAIENLAQLPDKNKILILGSMMELGTESKREHANILSLIGQYPWQHVVLTGKEYIGISDPYLHFNNAEEVREWLKNEKIENATILLKGSRGMQMEKSIDF